MTESYRGNPPAYTRRMPHNAPEMGERSPAGRVLRTGTSDIGGTGPKRRAQTRAQPDPVLNTADIRFVDEFELIGRCFRERATRRPGTVLGIGDDAALLDTGGLPLVRAWATAPFRTLDDCAGTARHVFGAAFIRLAARAATPRWATLALTLEAGAPAPVESFSVAAAALCDACGVDLVGGDTTRGPGRATVFASGTEGAHPRENAPSPSTAAVEARLALATADTPNQLIADLICACTELAARGVVILCDDGPDAIAAASAGSLELLARTDAAGIEALRAVAGGLPMETRPLASDG